MVLGAADQSAGDNRDVARMAVLLAGVPDTVPGHTTNRLCASGFTATASAAAAIRAGELRLAGARLLVTLLGRLEREGGRRGLATPCVGVGQGVAMLAEEV